MNSVMKKIKYINPPNENTYGKYREYLRVSSDYSCAYCTITESESPGATFNIDHFRPVKYFPQLKTTCINLRYSCPRCNSYKRDNWILERNGCIKDCIKCQTKVCTKNIFRFIDCLEEEPDSFIELNNSGELRAINGSKPAEYTIKYLRLNRTQLIKLRNVRRFLELWKQELLQSLIKSDEQIKSIELQFKEFNVMYPEDNIGEYKTEDQLLVKMARIQFEMLLTQAKRSKDFVESEIRRLEYVSEKRLSSDSDNID